MYHISFGVVSMKQFERWMTFLGACLWFSVFFKGASWISISAQDHRETIYEQLKDHIETVYEQLKGPLTRADSR